MAISPFLPAPFLHALCMPIFFCVLVPSARGMREARAALHALAPRRRALARARAAAPALPRHYRAAMPLPLARARAATALKRRAACQHRALPLPLGGLSFGRTAGAAACRYALSAAAALCRAKNFEGADAFETDFACLLVRLLVYSRTQQQTFGSISAAPLQAGLLSYVLCGGVLPCPLSSISIQQRYAHLASFSLLAVQAEKKVGLVA